ncbi:MAG: extracellular solute-binding protein [Actinobacteria bacterium]|nr:extracellular solute-binding protein [Actinomycetota bacterium]
MRTTSFKRILVGLAMTMTLVSVSLGQAQGGEPYVVDWITQPRGDLDQVVIEVLVDAFNEQHEDVQLNVIFQENHDNYVRLAIQAGNAPDIIQANGPSEAVQYALANQLVPLDEYAEQYNWDEKLLDWAYEVGQVGGTLYSVPIAFESMLLYYNAALFEEYGWVVPTNRAEIEEVCQAATEASLICFANGTGARASRGEWWLGWHLNGWAGPDKVYEALSGERPWTDPAFAESVDLNREWISNGWYNGRPDLYFALGHDENWSLIASDQALMRVAGSWDLARMQSFCPEDCDWAPAPSLNPEVPIHFELAIGETLSITTQSERPDLAAKVLDFIISGRERVADLIAASNFSTWFVPLEFSASDFDEGADPRVLRYMEEFANVTGEGRIGYTTWTFLPPRTRTTLFEDFELVVVGDLSVEDYLERVQSIFETELDSVPPAPQTAIKTQ